MTDETEISEHSPLCYTFLNAHYITEDGKTVEIITKEAGSIIVSEADRPDMWAKLIESSINIRPIAPLDDDKPEDPTPL